MPSLRRPFPNFTAQVADLLPAVSTPVPGIADVTGPMVFTPLLIWASLHMNCNGAIQLLGHVFSWALLGALTIQVYNYHVAFAKDDRLFMKLMVYGIYFLDLLQTAFATHYAWWVLASGWGNPWTLRFLPWTLGLVPILTGIVAMIVQFFFAWRIHVLGGGKWLLYPIIVFISITAVGQCAAAMYTGIVSDLNLYSPVTVWLSLSAACDTAITIVLGSQLRKRIGFGFGTYNPRLQRAIRLLLETNLITTIVVVAELITFLQRAVASWYFFFGFLIGKLYSNTLLATLNSRGSFTSTLNTEVHSTSMGGNTALHVWKAVSHEGTQVEDGRQNESGEQSLEGEIRGNSEEGTFKDSAKEGGSKGPSVKEHNDLCIQ